MKRSKKPFGVAEKWTKTQARHSLWKHLIRRSYIATDRNESKDRSHGLLRSPSDNGVLRLQGRCRRRVRVLYGVSTSGERRRAKALFIRDLWIIPARKPS